MILGVLFKVLGLSHRTFKDLRISTDDFQDFTIVTQDFLDFRSYKGFLEDTGGNSRLIVMVFQIFRIVRLYL